MDASGGRTGAADTMGGGAMATMTTTRSEEYRVVGVSDDVTTCECCGRFGLKRTVALMDRDGAVRHFGSQCAARALGRRARNAAAMVEKEALNAQPVVGYVVRNLTAGAYIRDQASGRLARFDSAGAEARVARIASRGMAAVVEPVFG